METHPVLGESASATTHEGKIETSAVQENEGTCEFPSTSTTTTATEDEEPSEQLSRTPSTQLVTHDNNNANTDEGDGAVGVPAAQPGDSSSLSSQHPASINSQQIEEGDQRVSRSIEQLDDGGRDKDNVSQDEHQEPDRTPTDREFEGTPQVQRSTLLASTSDGQNERSDPSPEARLDQGNKASQEGNQEERKKRTHVGDQSSLQQVDPSQQNKQEMITPQIHVEIQEPHLQSEDETDDTAHDVAKNQCEGQHVEEGQYQRNQGADTLPSSHQVEGVVQDDMAEQGECLTREKPEVRKDYGGRGEQVVHEGHSTLEQHPGPEDHPCLEEHQTSEQRPALEDHPSQEEHARFEERSGSEEETRVEEHTEHEADTRQVEQASVESPGVLPEVPAAVIAQQDPLNENQLAVPAINGTTQHQVVETNVYQQYANNSRDDASDHTVHSAPRSRRVWEADRHAAECRRCNRRFNFLVRRHHCRRCGLVVCDRCSSHRIRLPPEEIIQDPAIDPSHYPLIAMHPQRVCDACNRLPIKEVPSSASSPRRRATAPVAMSHMKRSASSQSLMTECPVCGTDLLGMQKGDQEKHLQLCLNTGSPPVRPPRYLVYELSETSPQIDYECPICFEEFKAGEKIARMICLCSYHRHCLSDWLERGKGCPVHYDATIAA